MGDRFRLPGPRDVRGTRDGGASDRVVVACPPHPQYGGDRRDSRLVAVADALAEDGINCLRFDYGEWDEGEGETTDALAALAWARERYGRVGLFGYSFGAGITLRTSARSRPQPDSVSLLAPPATFPTGESVAPLVRDIEGPLQVVYGERDDTATWEPVVEEARELGLAVRSFPADHFFVGQQAKVAAVVVEFLSGLLEPR